MIVRTLTVGAFQENCFLVADPESREAVLIDPGDEAGRLLDAVVAERCTLTAIWVTHAHLDHVGGIAAVKRAIDVPVWLHPLDRPIYDRASDSGARYGLVVENPPPPDHDLADGDEMTVGGLRFSVMHVPGHAPGHVAFVGHGVVFGGDCLFAGSIGRTDLPLSNGADLLKSLQRFAALPADTVVYAGHGPATTIGEELRSNPFLTGVARPISR